MVLRPATLCCFLLLVALATSAKIPSKNMHRQSSIEENREKNARSAKLEELMMKDKKIPSQEVSIVNMSGSGEDPDDDYWEDPIEELDEMHPVVTTTTEPPQPPTTETVTTTIPANENQLSGSCKSLANGNYLNPFDCKTFIYCFNGIAYILNCPTTLISGVQWNWCDITREAQNLPPCN
ncbi:hypothetical protein DAPPUDRAFT_241371 [Daphnia pulex]|uniref:Chitin-binding type-2 domain-containing protein n=1 Tax=Daphnia pulex TaxID=6669 RepID=E9GE37_DAPPU|nr:hypothetical protein DAPPUDRAFT_241371 [Daphnia pulex]|eukprot:EFX82202.1 hypothetical protein DAPPUDRAFT_241371 [Daphnia pulex]